MVPGQPKSGDEDRGGVPREKAARVSGSDELTGLSSPLVQATLCGILVRLLTAWLGPGFHARDDYFHVLAPALAWIDDPTFNWQESHLPGAGLRSELFPRLIQAAIMTAHSAGIRSPENVLSTLHTLLGLYSALAIPATWALCRNLKLSHATTVIATWLMALHFAMPYVGTRLLIESMSIPPLIFGLSWCAKGTQRSFLIGGFLVGMSTWFRYQVGAAGIGLALGIGWMQWRQDGLRGMLRHTIPLGLGAALALSLQGSLELLTTGEFLSSVRNNIAFNLNPPDGLTRSNPLSYLGFWLALTLPPVTFILAKPLLHAGRKLWLLSWPFIVFVALHSIVGHKEERFMIPMLPLFIIVLATAITELEESARPSIKRWWPPARAFLFIVHALALGLIMTSQSQQNLRLTMQTLRNEPRLSHLVSIGPEIQDYFLARKETVATSEKRHFDARWVHQTTQQIKSAMPARLHFISFVTDRAKLHIFLLAEGLRCQKERTINGWWLDRLAAKLNPRHNRRRAPIDLWSCEIPTVAQISQSSSSSVARVSKSGPNLSVTESARR
ncbi:MAG: hypothetical protein VX834_12785 [Myxococcota bacterium]|nr:hypothetical protein [Myxococcota bacterium]